MWREKIKQTLRLRPGERKIVLPFAILLAINAMAMEIGAVVSVSGFLSEVGTPQLLLVWVVDMALIIFIGSLQSIVIDKISRQRFMQILIGGLGLAYLIIRLLFWLEAPVGLNYALIYLLADQQLLFFPLIFWLLANDNVATSQAKRLFPLIAIGGLLGQVVGLLIAGTTARLFEQYNIPTIDLLFFNVAAYVIAFILLTRMKLTSQQAAQKGESIRETISEGWAFVREVPSFRYLMLAMIAVGLALTVIEFHFFVVSNATFGTQSAFQFFYSFYRLSIIALSIGMQSLLTSRLLERLGLPRIFYVVPAALLAGLAGMLLVPGVVMTAIGRALVRLPFATLDEAARKSFQSLVPESRRGRVSMFMDTYLYASGTIVGALVMYGLLWVAPYWSLVASYFYLAFGATAAFFALWSIWRMSSVYQASLLNWRLKRQRQKQGGVLDKLDF